MNATRKNMDATEHADKPEAGADACAMQGFGDDGALTPEPGEWEATHDESDAPQAPRDALPTANDAQLALWMAAIAEHDERALTALYDATFTRVFGLVRRIVRNTATAEEVVEDAYFQVWRQALRFDPARGKALTWLLAVARSRAIDALRREARFEHVPLDGGNLPELASEGPVVDELLDLAQHSSDLHRALMLLGAQPRQLVSLAFFRGLSHEEIAAHTRLPLGTVKSQIRRALLSLRQTLGSSGTPPALLS
ncbi:MAG: sigma-70 family RNA polymerase sigma factor [Proteobacteria bacterium]|nr:sigma-70 family RNA polymerase sigma factor [Pseudomonadota bacterium]